MEEFQLGTTVPHEEPCVQLGRPNYSAYSKMEANILMKQIVRELGTPPDGCSMKMIVCKHDFGIYYDVALVYNPENDELSIYVHVGLGPIDNVSWNANKKQKQNPSMMAHSVACA